MNLPNTLTLSRVPMMFLIVGLMYCDWLGAASLAFWFFIWGAVSDWLDGHIARKRAIVSNFGKLMDALTDKIMVVGLTIAFVDKNDIAVPLALLTMCREFLITGLRMVAAAKGVVVPADRGGKTKTVTQLIALGFLLAVPMIDTDWAYVAPAHWGRGMHAFAETVRSIGIWGFVAGTFFAIWSGYRYVRQMAPIVFTPGD